MRRQIEGSRAVAAAVALCRPQVICAYPISPQTHIVEELGVLVKTGALQPCQFINVESEFAAMSVAVGASAAGSRAYTATASQGLLYMAEAVYNAAGLGLPIVMTVANRAIGAPINIWNDHSDAMALRDAGWVQLYATDNQDAVDLHVQAFALAEDLSVPVMVCMDGFVLTHAVEGIDLPDQAQVDDFLPPFRPRQVLDPDAPVTIGAMVGPEAFTEVRYLFDAAMLRALHRLPGIAAVYGRRVGRNAGGLLTTYRSDDAETVVIAMGSVFGTLQDTVDDLRAAGQRVGAVAVRCYRPFPGDALRAALDGARRVVVIDRALTVGRGAPLADDVSATLAAWPGQLRSVIAGLGGRPVTAASLRSMIERAHRGLLPPRTFLDLDTAIVQRELTHTGVAP